MVLFKYEEEPYLQLVSQEPKDLVVWFDMYGEMQGQYQSVKRRSSFNS